MQSCRRLIEHIDYAKQIGVYLRCQSEALQLSRRKRGRASLQREIPEPQVQQNCEPGAEIFGDPPHHLRFFWVLFFKFGSGARRTVHVGMHDLAEPLQRLT